MVVGFKTGSLALVADAFHYLNDLIGFVIALGAILVTQRATSPKDFSFGWARASLLGAFFNGVFLLALGVSIFLQSIERFVSLQHVEDPKLHYLATITTGMIMGMDMTMLLTTMSLVKVISTTMIMATRIWTAQGTTRTVLGMFMKKASAMPMMHHTAKHQPGAARIVTAADTILPISNWE
ncbi:hypothetical protein LQW54_004955 [Pestalotiopsis sp. IQ-011]